MVVYLALAALILLLVWYGIMLFPDLVGLCRNSDQLNSTDDWTPVPEHDHKAPALFEESPDVTWLRVITPRLEEGERLEGFARAYFSPRRRRDWQAGFGTVPKCPLLIAATSRRMLLFELNIRLAVCQSCVIGYDAIQYLRPPKPGLWGTSGLMRFGLSSGREYQVGFLGPIIYEPAMRQERRLVDYLRGIARRYPSSRASDAQAA